MLTYSIFVTICLFFQLFCLLLSLQVDSQSSKSVSIVITIIIVMLLSIAAGVVFVKKYVCGGRLVHVFLRGTCPGKQTVS